MLSTVRPNRERLVAAKAGLLRRSQARASCESGWRYRGGSSPGDQGSACRMGANNEAARRGQAERMGNQGMSLLCGNASLIVSGAGKAVEWIASSRSGTVSQHAGQPPEPLPRLQHSEGTGPTRRTRPEIARSSGSAAVRRTEQPGYREELARRARMGACARWRLDRGRPCGCGQHHRPSEASTLDDGLTPRHPAPKGCRTLRPVACRNSIQQSVPSPASGAM